MKSCFINRTHILKLFEVTLKISIKSVTEYILYCGDIYDPSVREASVRDWWLTSSEFPCCRVLVPSWQDSNANRMSARIPAAKIARRSPAKTRRRGVIFSRKTFFRLYSYRTENTEFRERVSVYLLRERGGLHVNRYTGGTLIAL